MSGKQTTAKTVGGSKHAARLSFDAAFIGGSLAIGAMLFVVLVTLKGLFPVAQQPEPGRYPLLISTTSIGTVRCAPPRSTVSSTRPGTATRSSASVRSDSCARSSRSPPR